MPGGQGVAGSNPAVPTNFRTPWGPSGDHTLDGPKVSAERLARTDDRLLVRVQVSLGRHQ